MNKEVEKMPKFFVENNQIQNETIYIIGNDVNHIVNVLRLKKDDILLVCNKDIGKTYQTKIKNIQKEKVECIILEEVGDKVESKIEVSIFQGLPKAEKMEYIIQKSTELGVKKIIPVSLKRCIVKLDKKDSIKKLQRWQKIAEVAAKQSGRNVIPSIEDIVEMKRVKEIIKEFDLFLVAYEEEKNVTLKQELQKMKQKYLQKDGLKIGVLIGPEGGLEKEEVESLKQNGAKVITLGNRILRTETAPIAVLSNIIYEYDA